LQLARATVAGNLSLFLEKSGESEKLGGWMRRMQALEGQAVVVDHGMWLYFANRFGLEIAEHLEPKPGISPTTRHLREVIQVIEKRQVPVILTAAYFPSRHADFVARERSAKSLPMCHQVGCREGIDSYIAMIAYNIDTLLGAMGK